MYKLRLKEIYLNATRAVGSEKSKVAFHLSTIYRESRHVRSGETHGSRWDFLLTWHAISTEYM
jgi:hypothetical protein